MKKILKANKGFSLVELLIALLIMAVIAGTAITLFGGVLETSKGGADRETADAIKRAILTYINATNDTDLNCLGVANGSDSKDLVNALACRIVISGTTATLQNSATNPSTYTTNQSEVEGEFGPFLEKSDIMPTQNGMEGWGISVDTVTQIIKVTAVKKDTDAKVSITSNGLSPTPNPSSNP